MFKSVPKRIWVLFGTNGKPSLLLTQFCNLDQIFVTSLHLANRCSMVSDSFLQKVHRLSTLWAIFYIKVLIFVVRNLLRILYWNHLCFVSIVHLNGIKQKIFHSPLKKETFNLDSHLLIASCTLKDARRLQKDLHSLLSFKMKLKWKGIKGWIYLHLVQIIVYNCYLLQCNIPGNLILGHTYPLILLTSWNGLPPYVPNHLHK